MRPIPCTGPIDRAPLGYANQVYLQGDFCASRGSTGSPVRGLTRLIVKSYAANASCVQRGYNGYQLPIACIVRSRGYILRKLTAGAVSKTAYYTLIIHEFCSHVAWGLAPCHYYHS